MFHHMVKIIGSTIILVGLLACSSQNAVIPMGKSSLEKNWGRSYEAAKYDQILNPDAGRQPKPVEGIEGPAAERIMDSYIKGGDNKQKPPTEFGVVTIKQ